jgi:hypothetical protein
MKDEPVPLAAKTPRSRFFELGTKIMSAPKDEIERREAEWRASRRASHDKAKCTSK